MSKGHLSAILLQVTVLIGKNRRCTGGVPPLKVYDSIAVIYSDTNEIKSAEANMGLSLIKQLVYVCVYIHTCVQQFLKVFTEDSLPPPTSMPHFL